MMTEDPRIKYSAYTNATDVFLPAKVLLVVNGMTGNKNFPAPPITPESLKTMLNTYQNLIKPPGSRTSDSSDELDNARAIMLDALMSIGRYVEFTGGNDVAMLRSSGFELVTREKVVNVPNEGAVKQFRLSQPKVLTVACETGDNIMLYEARVAYMDGDKKVVKEYASQKATIDIAGLPLGVLLEIEIRKKNSIGYGEYGPVYKTRLPTEGESLPVKMKPKN